MIQEGRFVRELIEEVLIACREDDTGVTFDLLEAAALAAEEIGMTQEEMQEIADR